MSTLYLKYRPSKVAELDSREAREVLAGILVRDKLPHAWLFSGPRGLGKTSSARIIARALNCLDKGKDGEPCNKCEICTGIIQGAVTDVVEIDAASNRGIDEIRELREKVKLAPMRAKFKVFIIDEVHMLTTEAANALLKTLEEPPPGVVFLLCTTEAEKLPETVVSRCTQIKFRKPGPEEILAKIRLVAKGEKIKADEKGLELVARMAGGSFRDGIKILEQVAAAAEEINEDTVRKVTGMTGPGAALKLVELIRSGSTSEAIKLVNELADEGASMRLLAEKCVEEVRQEVLAGVAAKKDIRDGLELIESLTRAYEQMKSAVVPQLPLEMLIAGRAGMTTVRAEPIKTVIIPPAPAEKKPDLKTKVDPNVQIVVTEPARKGRYKTEDISQKWLEILKLVRPKNHSVEALLRSTKPMDFDGQSLTLEVFYKFHKDKLETEKCRLLVETAVGEAFGTGPVKLYLRLGEKGRGKTEELSGEGVGEDIIKAAEEIFKVEAI